MRTQIKKLLEKIERIKADEKMLKIGSLANHCIFLDGDTVLSEKSGFGSVRYPYSYDGLILWAYNSGNIFVQESQFTVVTDASEGREPNIAFFIGKKRQDGFTPVSVTGVAEQPNENVRRYTVFTPYAVWYIAEEDSFLSAVRIFVDREKKIRFSLYLENKDEAPFEGYIASYFNLFLFHMQHDNGECKWYKSCQKTDFGYLYKTAEYFRTGCKRHYAGIARSSFAGDISSTTSRCEFHGGTNRQLYCATPLFTGRFPKGKSYTEFTETAVSGDILYPKLKSGEYTTLSYTIFVGNGEKSVSDHLSRGVETVEIDEILDRFGESELEEGDGTIPEMQFGDLHDYDLSGKRLEYFMKNVGRQVEFCARAKNYAGPFIGIRDIFQQLEASCMWIPSYSRRKIVEALSFMGDNGRAPRQYSYPSAADLPPAMDLRPFVDQGLWILSTLYTYVCFTGDWSVLFEISGYYHFDQNTVTLCPEKDTVLEHLLRIADFLIANIDEETNCLHALYGDWNDALDGLGKTNRKGMEFGSGVSVMATLQLYRCLSEFAELLKMIGGHEGKITEYLDHARKIKSGLLRYALVSNGAGERKILHGWGDERQYQIGGFCDNDGKSRDSLTSNAFWVISGMLENDLSLKKDILNAYQRLDSKYGLKTFEPYFAPDNDKVGRIVHLPKGTAENGATYVHATLFGILSLFMMGESKAAWDQLIKIFPITHDFISTTPFIMSNSYAFNPEKGFDGESMSDWFTGSGCVLIKVMIWYVFGVRPDLNGLLICPPKKQPFKDSKLHMRYRGCELTVIYKNKDRGSRSFTVNGIEQRTITCGLFDEEGIYIEANKLGQKLTVQILD